MILTAGAALATHAATKAVKEGAKAGYKAAKKKWGRKKRKR